MSLSIGDIKQKSQELDKIKEDLEPLLKLPDEAIEFIKISVRQGYNDPN